MDKQEIEKHNREQEEHAQEMNKIIHRTEKPNSYEFGRAGNRYKLYFDTPEDLKAQLDKLSELGLYTAE